MRPGRRRTVHSAAAGAVEIRLSGEREDIEPVLALLAGRHVRQGHVIAAPERPAWRANRRDPGERAYLTVVVMTTAEGGV